MIKMIKKNIYEEPTSHMCRMFCMTWTSEVFLLLDWCRECRHYEFKKNPWVP